MKPGFKIIHRVGNDSLGEQYNTVIVNNFKSLEEVNITYYKTDLSKIEVDIKCGSCTVAVFKMSTMDAIRGYGYARRNKSNIKEQKHMTKWKDLLTLLITFGVAIGIIIGICILIITTH